MRDAFIAALTAHADQDERIMLVTGDLGFGVLTQFAEDYPRQYVNAGVAEQNMTGFATGLALEGQIVFTYSIGNFPTLRCLEQIRNDAAYHNANVNVVSIGGGFSYGALGMSHHATEDLAIMRAIPELTVLSPGCLWEVEQATLALIEKNGTGFLRLDKTSAGDTSALNDEFRVGVPRQVRQGSDVTVVTTGGILGEVLTAAEELSNQELTCDVFSSHSLKPFEPANILDSIARTRALVVVEEHVGEGGLTGAISEACLSEGVYPEQFRQMSIDGGFCATVGSQSYLRELYGLDASSIACAVQSTVARLGKSS